MRCDVKKSGMCACLLFAVIFLSGCAADRAVVWYEYKVYCGMSSGKGDVTEEEWQSFCDRYVSAAFPDGYTVLDGTGYWRSGRRSITVRERSKIILVIAPADAREKVLSVARQYRERFGQESVLVSGSAAEAEFVQEK